MYLKLSYFWLSNWRNVLFLGLYFTYNFGSYVLRWADILTYKMVSMYLGELIFSSTIWVIFKWADIIIYNMGLILVGWYSHPKSTQLREFHSVQLPVTSQTVSHSSGARTDIFDMIRTFFLPDPDLFWPDPDLFVIGPLTNQETLLLWIATDTIFYMKIISFFCL